MPKVSTPQKVNIQNPNAYNLIFWKYAKGPSNAGDGHNYIEGLIYEYSTNEILTYTLEDETDMKRNFPPSKKNPFRIIPAGNAWPNKNPWHRGCSSYTVSLAKGKGGFGKTMGAPSTMLAMDKSADCLFHPGKTTKGWTDGCPLCGNKPVGGQRVFQETEFYPEKIKTSVEPNVKWWRNFYDHVVPAICAGKVVHIYLIGNYSNGNAVADATQVNSLESEDVLEEQLLLSGSYIKPIEDNA